MSRCAHRHLAGQHYSLCDSRLLPVACIRESLHETFCRQYKLDLKQTTKLLISKNIRNLASHIPFQLKVRRFWYAGLGQRHLPENILAACIQDALVRNRLASSIATWTSAIRVFVLAQTSGQSFPSSKLLQLSLSDQ